MAFARVVHYAVMAVFFSLHCNGNFYPSLQWTPENPKFTPSNGHFKMKVLLTYRMNLICPNTATVISQTDTNLQKLKLYENVWIVDKGSFESCHVNTSNRNNKRLMACDTPLKLKYYTLLFQTFSADLADTVFEKGQSYYFIATSNGSRTSLGSTKNGHCNTGMKMEVYVCQDKKDCESPKTTPATTTPKETEPTLSGNALKSLPDGVDGSTGNNTASEEPDTPSARDEPVAPNVAESVHDDPSRNDDDSMWYALVAVLGVSLIISLIVIIFVLYCKNTPNKCHGECQCQPL